MDSLGLSAQAAVQKTSAVPRSVPPHLLMTSILEQVCHSYVKDTTKAEQLFKGVLAGVGLKWMCVACAGAKVGADTATNRTLYSQTDQSVKRPLSVFPN